MTWNQHLAGSNPTNKSQDETKCKLVMNSHFPNAKSSINFSIYIVWQGKTPYKPKLNGQARWVNETLVSVACYLK